MRSHQLCRLSVITVGQRDSRVGCAGKGRRQAWNHLVMDAMLFQEFQFFAAAAENKRVPAFEPDDMTPLSGMFQQQGMNALLSKIMVLTQLFAHGDEVCIAPRKIKNGGVDQAVIQNDISFIQSTQGFEREQSRIARARADQRHFTHSLGWCCM